VLSLASDDVSDSDVDVVADDDDDDDMS